MKPNKKVKSTKELPIIGSLGYKPNKKVKGVKITERGFAGHFCASQWCWFRRNTLIEIGDKRIVVSTVGNYNPPHGNKGQEIGYGRYYETMAFNAIKKGIYWEADVSREITFKSKWSINELEFESDMEADMMHDNVVKELLSISPTTIKKGNKK